MATKRKRSAVAIRARDIGLDIGPLFAEREEVPVRMFSFERPAHLFWQGAFTALIKSGMSEASAFAWLQSKSPRWLLDSTSDQVEQLGFDIVAKEIGL